MGTPDQVLAGKVVLVTGAGRGIGAAYAAELARRGATVIVNDVDAPEAEAVTASIVDSGCAAVAAPGDVSDPDVVNQIVVSTVELYGTLDGLVNNAAVFQMAGLRESTPQVWDAMLRSNVLGVAVCGQRVAEQMTAQGSGSIVNITSGAQCGLRWMSVYGATKAAVAALTYTWAIELEPYRIRVNAVSPRGASRMTEHGAAFLHEQTGQSSPTEPDPAVNAPAVAYLLSDLAHGVTGQVIRVEGQDIGLMTHPAVLAPMVTSSGWDVESLSAAFDRHIRPRLQPVGVAGLDVAAVLTPGAGGWRIGHE